MSSSAPEQSTSATSFVTPMNTTLSTTNNSHLQTVHGLQLLNRLSERTADQDYASRCDIVLLEDVLKKMDDQFFLQERHVEDLSTQLKQEQDRNHELQQAYSIERKEAADMQSNVHELVDCMSEEIAFYTKMEKALRNNMAILHERAITAQTERNAISTTLQTTNRELKSEQAALDEAKMKISMLSAELLQSLEKRPESDSVSLQHECTLCMNAEVDALFPCGRVACCMTCAFKLPADNADEFAARCPFCREKGQFKKVYFA